MFRVRDREWEDNADGYPGEGAVRKKRATFFFLLAFGNAVGITAYGITKKKQKKAREEKKHVPYGIYEAVIKRLLDIFLSGTALVILSPVMLATGLLVKKNLGSPVIFCQKRPGLDGKIFTIYKFRTMKNEYDEDGALLSDEERLTDFGKRLRSTSLDELPELCNIFAGDMSIVGPRPLLVEYLDKYDEKQRHRHDVKPGLTGYAQVSGRNRLSWNEKFEDDVKYAGRITFLGDLKIVLKTVQAVLKRDGISSVSSATMEPFEGNGNGE